jgi:ABC-type transport system substrate-binding protein
LTFFGLSWADPHEHLHRYFFSGNIPAPNYQRTNDGEFDRLVSEAARIADKDRRSQLYGQADEILVGKAYVGPLFHAQGIMAVRTNVRGLRPYGEYNAGWPQLLDVTVSP